MAKSTIQISALIIYCLMLFFSYSTNSHINGMVKKIYQELDTQTQFFWHGSNDQMLISSNIASNLIYANTIKKIKEKTSVDNHTAQFIDDEIFFDGISSTKRIYKYNKNCQCIKELSDPNALQIIKSNWKKKRVNKSLKISAKEDGDRLSWTIGPYTNGQYFFISDDKRKIKINPVGKTPASLNDFNFLIRFDSDEGWISYSPPLRYIKGKGIVARSEE